MSHAGQPHPHVHHVRVYYEDTDFSGVVYHASYLRFMERGRTEMLRANDIHQGALQAGAQSERFGFVVKEMQIDFRKPARMDDWLGIETRLVELGGASLKLEQRVTRGAENLVTAQVLIACVADGRPFRIPAAIRARLIT